MTKQNLAKLFTQPNDRIRLRLGGHSRPYDPRITAIRPDLADVAEAARHLAPHYAAASPHHCTAMSAMVHGQPDDSASAVTQLLHGELFQVLDERAGWAWGYSAHDHYVGYLRMEALALGTPASPTHRVKPNGGLLLSRADIKSPAIGTLPAGALLSGAVDGSFLVCADGYVHLRHVAPVAEKATDPVTVARHYLGQPYLWGGRGAGGLDCSGLVQIALSFCGIATPRDTDQQAASVGETLAVDQPLMRGDLVYFPGHVGIMTDGETLLHANAHWMCVVEEPLADVVARLVSDYPQPIVARRRVIP
jgi:cell wall-associated NlpC family hydrolase